MKLTPTKFIHYGLLLIAAYIVYSWLTKGGGRDSYDNHPRNRDKFRDTEKEAKSHKYAQDARHVKVEKEYVDEKLKVKHEDIKNIPPPNEPIKQDDVVKEEKIEVPQDSVKEEIDETDIKEDEVPVNEEVVQEVNDDERSKDSNDKKLKFKNKEDEGIDLLKEINDADLRGDPDIDKQIDHNLSDHKFVKIPKLKRDWQDEHDDIEMAEEKKNRRKLFFERVRTFEEEDMIEEDIHIHENTDDFPFVTAANSDTYHGALSFIHSVQMNYPRSQIGIFNIGLSAEEIAYMKTLCDVEVLENYLPLFPAFMSENMGQKLWRPAILQLALAKYGHFVYVDPMRYLKRGVNLRGHFDLSRKGGVAIFGKVKSYSTAVVTNPEMLYYLAVNVRKLLRLQHVEINMVIMHNSKHLQHFFTRWFMSCAREEYCIAPPGSKRKCNQNLYPKSHKYADCHRYDESAINVLLASWHKYDYDHYAAGDHVTAYYDGRDAKSYLKVCGDKKRKEGL